MTTEGKDMLSLQSGSGNIEDNGVDSWSMRQGNIRPCSVRLKRFKPSQGLFWEVEKVKLKDETILQYSGIVVQEIIKAKSEVQSLKTKRDCTSRRRGKLKDRAPDMFKGTGVQSVVGDGDCQIKADLVNVKDPSETLLENSCPKCDRKFRERWDMRTHALSHYKHLFYPLLPDKKPFICPVCQKIWSQKQDLMRHYALGHKMVFQLTDLTPEDLQCMR